MGISSAPSWEGTGEVKYSKHIKLQSGSDYTVLDKFMNKRAADDAKAPGGTYHTDANADDEITLTDTRKDSSDPDYTQTFKDDLISAVNWSQRKGVELSYVSYDKQGDGSWLCTAEWEKSLDYLTEFEGGILTRDQSCTDGWLIGVFGMQIKYEMLRGENDPNVIKLEKFWDREDFGHLKRNGQWNSTVFTTRQDGKVPGSTEYPAGHPLAS